MLDFLRETRLRVLALGTSSALVILWLSTSFWVDAWQESTDAKRFERLSALERRMQSSARDFAAERALTLGMTDLAAGGTLVLGECVSLDGALERLRALRTRSDAAVDALIDSMREVLTTPALLRHMRYETDSPGTELERLEAARLAVLRRRSHFDAKLKDGEAHSASTFPGARTVLGALRVQASIGELERELDRLRNGFQLEPYTARPGFDALARLRSALHTFARTAETRRLLRGLSTTYGRMPGARAALSRALTRASFASRDATRAMEWTMSRDRIDPYLQAELRALLEENARIASARFPTEPAAHRALLARALALDTRLAEAMSEKITAAKARSYRRLVIDSALIAGSFWLVFVSLRLLERIRHQTRHDPLTALPNRASFEERLREAPAHRGSGEGDKTLLMIDIDDFKSVNDTFGHDVGDELIRRLGARLAARLPQGAMLAALGGDEFAVLWSGDPRAEATAVAERLRGACDETFEIDGAELGITLSIGASGPGDRAHGVPDLLGRASIAMRQAKDAGKDRVHAFSPELAERNRLRTELERDLRRAVGKGQLELHYQPKVDAASGRVSGAEALVRWRHPERGLVSPGTFIPLAERCGLIVPLGAWVLEEAVRQTVRWRDEGLEALQVAVNVSAEQLVAAGFDEWVESVLATHGLAPHRLELEVTESVGMMNMEVVIARLTRLRAAGVSIAIDDFGTDYSSLQYLEDLPLDTLKIDRAFVVKLDRPDQGRSLVNTIVLMARSFGLRTVAEGVETEAQLAKVIALGCDQVQGYHHSKPVPADELPFVVARIEASSTDGARRAA